MNSPFYSCIFDEDITDSYCWTISKDSFFVIGGAFPISKSNMRFEMLKEKRKNKKHRYIIRGIRKKGRMFY
jgi:hypothetical protein